MAGKKEKILNRVLNRGFTLIELLITICVLSVLLIFAAPSFSSLFESSRMKTAQDELMGFVIMAKVKRYLGTLLSTFTLESWLV
ncbi:pilus assembly FimT family protein [Vibrio vulnificus]|uniref:pilus assembly FimT family protein n=1 Tax=Vibrio vulnificus TaxID=672 RepID=UPI0037C2D532